jgi:hypothetical protein
MVLLAAVLQTLLFALAAVVSLLAANIEVAAPQAAIRPALVRLLIAVAGLIVLRRVLGRLDAAAAVTSLGLLLLSQNQIRDGLSGMLYWDRRGIVAGAVSIVWLAAIGLAIVAIVRARAIPRRTSGVLALSRALESRGRYATLGPSGLVLLVVVVGGWAAWRVHVDLVYAKEDWRSLARAVAPQGTLEGPIWRDGANLLFPLAYYLGPEVPVLDSPSAVDCQEGCWFVTRKPYTATHAFGSAVQEPDRPWTASAPAGCQERRGWRSEAGIAALWIVCGSSNG